MVDFYENFYLKFDNENLKEDIEVCEIAISAIEKQIPKKIKATEQNSALCPSCGHMLSESIGDGDYKHLEVCSKCYQALEWDLNE